MRIEYLDSPNKVFKFWEWLTQPGREFLAADTETTGLQPFSPGFRCRLFQFGDENTGWAIPFQGWQNLIFAALDYLADNGIKCVWHNVAYDAQVLAVSGYDLRMEHQEDTFVWASLIGFTNEVRELKVIAAKKFGPWAKFGQSLLNAAMRNAGWTWATVPLSFSPYSTYGVVDTILTARLWKLWEEDRKKYAWHHALEVSTIESTNRMSRRGLGVNTIYAAEKAEVLAGELSTVMAQLEPYGITSLSQNAKIAQVLNEAGAFKEFIEYTDKGQISVAKSVLGKLDHPAAEMILLGRHIARTRQYLTQFIDFAGGRMSQHELIHPSIKSIEARTSRMSVAEPALQQLPAPTQGDPMSYYVRTAVVPRTAEEILVGGDFGQIELRMFASITRDEALLDVLNRADAAKAKDPKDPAGDFFVTLGRTLYADPGFLKSDPRRQYLKSTAYAKLYSGGLETIAKAAHVSVTVIGDVVRDLEAQFPSFRTLGSELIKQSSKDTFEVYTPSGRKFSVNSRDERRKLMNYLVQGHSAEILKRAIFNLVAAGYGDALMLPVHDEIIMSVPIGTEVQATCDLVECMDSVVDPAKYGVSVRASAAPPAMSWGELTH